jgi:hypothetical protein
MLRTLRDRLGLPRRQWRLGMAAPPEPISWRRARVQSQTPRRNKPPRFTILDHTTGHDPLSDRNIRRTRPCTVCPSCTTTDPGPLGCGLRDRTSLTSRSVACAGRSPSSGSSLCHKPRSADPEKPLNDDPFLGGNADQSSPNARSNLPSLRLCCDAKKAQSPTGLSSDRALAAPRGAAHHAPSDIHAGRQAPQRDPPEVTPEAGHDRDAAWRWFLKSANAGPARRRASI